MKFLLTLIVIILCLRFAITQLFPWLVRVWVKSVQKKMHVNNTPKQKKRIDQSEGDYIDFEEIE